jgi:hypothetical protein
MRRSYAAIPVVATLILAGCGENEDSPQEPAVTTTSSSSVSSSPPPTTSSTPPEPSEALATGVVIRQCDDDGLATHVLSYSATPGAASSEPLTYRVNNSTGSIQSNAYCNGMPTTHEGGRSFRSAFNADFTKYFVAVKDSATGTSVVGYYSPDGEFTQISTVGDEFTKTDHRYPTFHVATGKLLFWDYAGQEPQLMSVAPPEPGSTPQPEPELAKMAYYGNDIYAPLTEKLLIADNEDDVAFNDAGTLVADIQGGVKIAAAGDPIALANNTQAVPFDKEISTKAGRSQVAVGFLDDDSVVFTDGQQVYRADVQGGMAVVTVLHANTNEDTAVANVTIRGDKSSIAFLATSGGETALYVKPIDSVGDATRITVFPPGVHAQILQFN